MDTQGPEPEAVLDSKIIQGQREFLVHWGRTPASEDTWMDAKSLATQFPSFMLEDDHDSAGGSSVMNAPHHDLPYTSPGPTDIVYKRGTHGKHREVRNSVVRDS